jgi:hypothetical protein
MIDGRWIVGARRRSLRGRLDGWRRASYRTLYGKIGRGRDESLVNRGLRDGAETGNKSVIS